MRQWTPDKVASAASATLPTGVSAIAGPELVTIDSRAAGPGALFVGLPGANVDGGAFAAQALEAGAWGVLVTPGSRRAARRHHARPASSWPPTIP